MRIDWYTKAVLTAIAVLLGVIAARPYLGPEVVQAQGAFSGVQYVGSGAYFDSRTGENWVYDGDYIGHCRLTKLGQPRICDK